MDTIRIANKDVDKDAVWLYIQHFGRDKTDLWSWEHQRRELHDNIFETLGLDRYSDEGKEFSIALDEFCEPHILKYDRLIPAMKKFSNSRGDEETKRSTLNLQLELYREQKMAEYGFRNPQVDDEDGCRVCGEEIKGARVNDHLANVLGFNRIHKAICHDCSETNPDEYHIAFKKQYWSKK